MYKYEEPSIVFRQAGGALLVVILLHVVVGWAFYTGLAGALAQTIIPPVEIAQIDKPKDVDKPPPPRPSSKKSNPTFRLPNSSTSRLRQEQTNAIAVVTQTQPVAAPPPVAAAPRAEAGYSAASGSEASAEDRRGVVSGRIEARQ